MPDLPPSADPHVSYLPIDPRRSVIEAERFARPPLPVDAPALVQQLVFQGGQQELSEARAACAEICRRLNVAPTSELPDQVTASGGGLTIKWEQHTEFQSYTITASGYLPMTGQQTWCQMPLGWELVGGRLLVSQVIAIEPAAEPSWSQQQLFRFADPQRLSASKVNQGATTLLADLRADPHGRTRYLVRCQGTPPAQVGRLVQRLIEIETYSALALLALPRAKEVGPKLAGIDRQLQSITESLAAGEGEDEQVLLQLTDLAAESERLSAATLFRLNASIAYAAIVAQRVEELLEERLDARTRLGSFVSRRLVPAARTFRAVLNRQREQSERIERTGALLRVRVEVEQNKQTQELLTSMNARAEAQFRLQKTVEGLSTVAISYYALSILGYLYGGLLAAFPALPSVKVLVALSTPVVLLLVWLGLRRIRH